MPIYEYRRPDGTTFEIAQSFSDERADRRPRDRRAGRARAARRPPCTSRAKASTTPTTARASASARRRPQRRGPPARSPPQGRPPRAKRLQSSSSGDSGSNGRSLGRQSRRAKKSEPIAWREGIGRDVGREAMLSARSPLAQPTRAPTAAQPLMKRATAARRSASETRQAASPSGQRHRRRSGFSTRVGGVPEIAIAPNRPSSVGPLMSEMIAGGAFHAIQRQAHEARRREQPALHRVEQRLLVFLALQVGLRSARTGSRACAPARAPACRRCGACPRAGAACSRRCESRRRSAR